jgi:hypothetical protein
MTPPLTRECEAPGPTEKQRPTSLRTDTRPFETEAALLIRRALDESGVANDEVPPWSRDLVRKRSNPAPSFHPSVATPLCPSPPCKTAVAVAVAKKVGVLLSTLVLLMGAIALLFITLVAMVVNVIAFALVVASLLVSCAIMIGPVASAVVEGALMTMYHPPYEVGDRIMMSSMEDGDMLRGDELETMSTSQCWVVESVSLFKTSLRNVITDHVAAVSNSYLARRPIRNLTRSGQAQVNIAVSLVSDSPSSNISVRLRCLYSALLLMARPVHNSLFGAISLPLLRQTLKRVVSMFVDQRPQVRSATLVWPTPAYWLCF